LPKSNFFEKEYKAGMHIRFGRGWRLTTGSLQQANGLTRHYFCLQILFFICHVFPLHLTRPEIASQG